MRTLTIVEQPGYTGSALITARVTLKSGREFYVCNPMPELTDAMDAGAAFKAHSIVGMTPVECIVNPAHVATVESC